MNYISLAIFFSFYPFPIASGINLSAPDLIIFFGFLINIIFKFRDSIRFLTFKLLFPYALFITISVTASNITNLNTDIGFSPIIKYSLYCLIIPIFFSSVIPREINIDRADDIINKLIKNSCLSGFIFCCVLLTFVGFGIVEYDSSGNYYIYQYHKNASGVLLFFSASFGFIAILTTRHYLGYITLGLSIIILLLTGSRAYFLALIGFIASCLIMKSNGGLRLIKNLALFTTLSIAILLLGWSIAPDILNTQVDRFQELLVSPEDEVNSANSRFVLWAIAINDFLQNPLLGIGYGGFNPNLGGFFDGITDPHNALLQIMGQGGIIGLTSFGLLFYNYGKLRRLNSNLMAGKYISSILIFYIIAGMFGIIWVRGDGHIFWMLFWFTAIVFNQVIPTSNNTNLLESIDTSVESVHHYRQED